MSRSGLGWLAIAGGTIGNNAVYLSDLIVKDAPCIWLGPTSGSLIVATLATVAVGVWLVRTAT